MEISNVTESHLFVPQDSLKFEMKSEKSKLTSIPKHRFIFEGDTIYTEKEQKKLDKFKNFGKDDFQKQFSYIYYDFL